ncbi:MAG TPA: hypothetical protein VFX21_06015, partial [Acidimicrobiia bacterium]|nr:hypothetical protein [Acidimicrobiia bacterium]
GIDNSRFANDLEGLQAKHAAELDDMERTGDRCPDLPQSVRDEVAQYRAGFDELSNTLPNVARLTTEAAALARKLATQLDQAMQQRTATTLVDPATATLVEAARTLLLAQMSVTRATALAGSATASPPTFGLPPQVQAELKAFDKK